ncbi:MAG: substrate-binding domain-containing protein [Candidatus Acidiferrales bacterium]
MRHHRFPALFPIVLPLAMLLASCQKPYHTPEEHYIYVAANINVPYWQEAEAGFQDAAAELGVKAEMTGPETFSPNDELTAFQKAVEQKPSGILVSAASAALFKPAIDAAIAQGIPVICADADSPDSHRILFIGTDNYRAGQESGRRIAELLKGQGNVAIITIPGQSNIDERVRGVGDALKKFPGIKIVQTYDDKGDSRNAYDSIVAAVQGKEKLGGIVTLEASGGEGAADALHRFDLDGKIPIVAFDKDPETLDWISRGAITATIAQKPYVMSYYGLKFLDDLHHNAVHEFKDWQTAPVAPIPTWVDTGTAVVDKSNIKEFREALAAHPKPM